MIDTNSLWPGWETVKPIGKGGFGTVYEIRRSIFDETEKAALKVITIPQSDDEIDALYSDGYDRESVVRTYNQHLKGIVKEYSMMRRLSSCQNIVNCDDVRYEQHTDGIGWDIFIKMELLTPLLKAFPGAMSEKLVIKAGKDLCNALIMCKRYGVLHRDIKPQNIFVSNNGTFKLGDFGVAKAVETTMSGTKIGTYKYMAPEVYNNQPYGSAADLYSLGLVLYWMLNEHRMPFLPMPPAVPSHTDNEQAKLRRFRGEPLPPPKNGCDALKAIVLKACAYNPADRFESAAQMLAALHAAEQEDNTGTRTVPTDPDVTVRIYPESADQSRTPEQSTQDPEDLSSAPEAVDPAEQSTIWEAGPIRAPESTFDPEEEPSDRSLLWVPIVVLAFILTVVIFGFILL